MLHHQNRSADVHNFAIIPRADVPRSSFDRRFTLKTAFDAGYLVPVLIDEVLPGDSFRGSMTAFARLTTPIVPFMDNLYLESFFFFVPNRLVWANFKKFMGEQAKPTDSISYIVPTCTTPAGGYAVNSVQDYFGLPTVGQMPGANTFEHNNLPLRAYNLIYNEWFRDENLQDSVVVDTDDGPDAPADYVLLRRGKRKDYFTSCLPWPQKGAAVNLPLGTTAPIKANTTFGNDVGVLDSGGVLRNLYTQFSGGVENVKLRSTTPAASGQLYADLSAATSATINQLRQSFQIQKLLERDARGGTRYTEIVLSHFGVQSPDARLQRPEYIGGGQTNITITPIAQTSSTDATSPQGNLSAVGTGLAHGHDFTYHATEHGYLIGLVNVRADLLYQQGVRKLWNRSTRYDFYFPVFAHLGEQAVLNREIYVSGNANDTGVFGYQARWDEYRYFPSLTTGYMRSTAATPLDIWHTGQKFTSLPTLGHVFIQDTPPIDRIVAVGAAANGKQFYLDALFNMRCVRPLPMFSVPGLVDHF